MSKGWNLVQEFLIDESFGEGDSLVVRVRESGGHCRVLARAIAAAHLDDWRAPVLYQWHTRQLSRIKKCHPRNRELSN